VSDPALKSSEASAAPAVHGVTRSPSPPWNVDTLGGLVFLGLTIAAYLLGAAPLLDRHDAVRRQLAELAAGRIKSREASAALAVVQRELAAARRQITAIPLRLQPASQLNQRLALVTDLAMRSGATLDDLQPGRPIDGARYGVLPIRVAGTGSYPTFAALLSRLRTECPDSGINGFDVYGTPAQGAAPAKFSFELVWYTQPAVAASPAPPPTPASTGK
jgi:hypothetical protein